MAPTTEDMVNRIMPRHKVITRKATVLPQTRMIATTVVVRVRRTKGNLESIVPRDALRVSHSSTSLVSLSRIVPFVFCVRHCFLCDWVLTASPLFRSSQTFPGMFRNLPHSPMPISRERRHLWAIPARTCTRIRTSPPRSSNVPSAARQSFNGTGR